VRRRGITRAGLVALLPIVAGEREKLDTLIRGFHGGEGSPFARVESTHFARLVVLPVQRFPAVDGPENLPACLLFSSEFDITPEGYLEALCTRIPAEAHDIFKHCTGYPGVSTPPRFQRWVLDHHVKAGFSIHGNPDATVDRIRRSLALRDRLIAFVVASRDDDPAALLRRWRSEDWEVRPLRTVGYRSTALEPVPFPARSHDGAVRQDDLQGNILCGYGRRYGYGLYVFARVEEPAAARAWIAGQVPRVTTAVPWEHAPADTLNLAFTCEGLRALEVDEKILASFPVTFRDGMKKRAARLGDTDESDPEHWDQGLSGAHVLVSVMAGTAEARDQRLDELRRSLPAAGFSADITHQKTAFTADGSEPFGFRDGISQPPIRDPKAGPYRREGDREPIRPGEFVLGYEDEGGCLPPEPDDDLGRNGSYMVVRKLEQDVAGFWKFIREQAGPDRGRQEWLAAKIVGRWRDGTPMALSPELPGGLGADRGKLNDFGYAEDGRGLRCPIGAHVRRTNPRDALDRDGDLSRRHRIIRRGMPLDGEDGLMFVCFQASIARQFEFVQALWCGDGNAFGLGDEADFLVGPPSLEGKMTVQGIPPTLLPRRRFVTMRGGDYFFAPGIAALRSIAGPRPPEAATTRLVERGQEGPAPEDTGS
jgi:Dyp-type peroxidase family